MSSMLGWVMLFLMGLLLPVVLADTLDSQFTLADSLRPPGLPIAAATLQQPVITEVERQGRVRDPFDQRRHPSLPFRVQEPRALFQPPPLLPPQPLFNHIDDSNTEFEMSPELKKILKDFSMADLPLAGEGENQLPGFFAPEFNDRFTPDENAPIISVTTPDRQEARPLFPPFGTPQLAPQSNQLPIADQQETRPLFPPFDQHQVAPQSTQLPLDNQQEARPLFPPFDQPQVASQTNQLPLDNQQEARPLFPPFDQQQVVPQSNQLPLGNHQEARPLFSPFDQQQVVPQSNQLTLGNQQEARPLFLPFDQQQVVPQLNQLPLGNQQEARPLFTPFGPQQVAPQFAAQVQQTTTTTPFSPPETSSQQFKHLVPDTLKSIFPTFSDANFGSEFPPFIPNPSNPTTPESFNTAITEPFIPDIENEFPNPVNQGFQDQENLELSNEFPPGFNNNPALNDDELFHPLHVSGLEPPIEHTSQGIHNSGPNRRPPKHFRKRQPNGSVRNPKKNQGSFVPHNGRVPRQLHRRPLQQPLRSIETNNGRRPLDQRRPRSRPNQSVWSTVESIFASVRGRFRSSRSRRTA